MAQFLFKKLSYLVLKFAFSVHNVLGPGLLESAYESAFVVELALAGVPFQRQKVFPLIYKDQYVWRKTPSFSSQKSANADFCTVLYIADFVIGDKIIVELKSVSMLNKVMEAQLLNYLKLSHLKAGYLMNFNSTRLEWKRFVNQGKGA